MKKILKWLMGFDPIPERKKVKVLYLKTRYEKNSSMEDLAEGIIEALLSTGFDAEDGPMMSIDASELKNIFPWKMPVSIELEYTMCWFKRNGPEHIVIVYNGGGWHYHFYSQCLKQDLLQFHTTGDIISSLEIREDGKHEISHHTRQDLANVLTAKKSILTGERNLY